MQRSGPWNRPHRADVGCVHVCIGAQAARAADVDEFLGSDDDEDGLDDDDEDDDADGEGEFDEEGEDGAGRRHALMLHAAGVGATTRKRKLAKARAVRAVVWQGLRAGVGPRRLTRALRRPRAQVVLTEAYPESEFNLNPAPGSAGDLLSAGAGLRCGARRVRTFPCS